MYMYLHTYRSNDFQTIEAHTFWSAANLWVECSEGQLNSATAFENNWWLVFSWNVDWWFSEYIMYIWITFPFHIHISIWKKLNKSWCPIFSPTKLSWVADEAQLAKSLASPPEGSGRTLGTGPCCFGACRFTGRVELGIGCVFLR